MVQQFGLQLLILEDGRVAKKLEADQLQDQLRLALVAAGADPAEIFSEPEPESYDDFDPAQDEGRDFDYSAVDWQESTSADDWTRMQEAMEANRVTVSDEGEGPIDDGPEVPDDFDREWQ